MYRSMSQIDFQAGATSALAERLALIAKLGWDIAMEYKQILRCLYRLDAGRSMHEIEVKIVVDIDLSDA